MSNGGTTIVRKFRKNRKNDHFLQSSTLKMVGLLQLKLPTSTPAGFLINGLIMNLLQYIFPQAENLVFQFPKSRGRIFLCVSPTFASPIEKPATSAHRRICREIIENTEGNAKTVDSLRRCKRSSSASKSAPKRKNRPEVRSAENLENGRPFFYFSVKFSPPQSNEFFKSLKMDYFHYLEKFSTRIIKIRTTSKSGLYIAKTLSQGFELATSTCGLR